MALTLTPLETLDVFGKRKAQLATATFDNSYTAGGLVVTAPALNAIGISNVVQVLSVDSCATTGHVVRFDRSTKKLLAFNTDRAAAAAQAGQEVAPTTNISTAAITVLIIGD